MITVLFSGGQDSTTCLLGALAESLSSGRRERVHALSVYYRQRHAIEMQQAREICKLLGVDRTELCMGFIFDGSESSMLMDGKPPPDGVGEGVAPTFLPGRNGLFIQVAATWASRFPLQPGELNKIYIGVNSVDYSGYPDCRGPFVHAMADACRLGFEHPVELVAPLLELNKKQIVEYAYSLEDKLRHSFGDGIVDKAMKLTHTCYNGQRPACGRCAACLIRIDGFQRAGIPDPIAYRNEHEAEIS